MGGIMKFKLLVFGLIFGSLLAMNVHTTNAASVTPVFLPGASNSDKTCAVLDNLFGGGQTWLEFKIQDDSPQPGDILGDGTFNDGSLEVEISNFTPTSFDWSSNFGVDAVVVKSGSDGSNLYVYQPPGPESTGDTQLSTPSTQGISHISFCYDLELQVTKTAVTSFDREWDWTIDKVCDETALTLSPGQTIDVDCDVTVDAASTDSGWAVEGEITIHNPAPATSATVTDVSDVISGVGAVDVDCGAAFPIVIGAGQDLVCTYSSDLPDGTNRTNTATVTTSGTIGGGSGQAAVTFGGAPTTETDECIDVDDDQFGVVGTWCAADGLPHTFTYTQAIGPFTSPDQCGENLFVNVATFTTNDTQTTDSDDHTITVTVPCVLGCTLTQGYWKTHNDSFRGGAPTDDNWDSIVPDAEGSDFFDSDMSWFEVFWTAPKGNVYYNLAHQYMAAVLNSNNGAAVPSAVQDALDDAEDLFSTRTPAQIAALKGNNPIRVQFLGLAVILGSYNEGLIGPGHCSE